ncbi:MAG TPA: Uma2 family endonuclease [Thermoanaerobaculia bacterium]|nr:Uma2 family endonuclease [Thermoanaerobaculia bacterium]
MTAIPLRREVEYPDSDGRPMAETEIHLNEMLDLLAVLKRRYRGVPDVYVGGDLFLYYRQGDPRSVVAPDVFFVRGVPSGVRKTFKLWEEGVPPCFIVEVTSESTRDEDLRKKKALYEQLGVEEYFLHDPEGDYLSPQLQGFRLFNDRYTPIRPKLDGSLESRTTGLTLRIEGTNLRLIDTATGERLLWVAEMDFARQAAEERARTAEGRARTAEERAEREAAARKSLEQELASLRAALERGGHEG